MMEPNTAPLVEVVLETVTQTKVLVKEGMVHQIVKLRPEVGMAESREVTICMVAAAELLVQRAMVKTARVVKEINIILVLVVVVVLGIILAAAAAAAVAPNTVTKKLEPQAIVVVVEVETEDMAFMDRERWVPHLKEPLCALVELEGVIGTNA